MASAKHCFSRHASPAEAATASAASGELNPATWPRSADLVALRRQASTLAFAPAGPARAQLTGAHASRFRGRGMDYQESRAYQAGDDVRHMDWRVTARTGTAQVKLYQEERERPVLLFLHLHAGMFFGTRGMLKSAAAARAAALIAWAAVGRGDRLGAVLSNGGHGELQPRGGRQGALRFIQELVRHTDPRAALATADTPSSLNSALDKLSRVTRPGSQVFLLGDFIGLDAESGQLIHRLRRHNDVVAVQVVDAIELAPPPPARYGVAVGAERGVLDLRSAAARRAFRAHFERHHRAVEDTMRRHGVPLSRLATDQDIVRQVRQLLAGVGVQPADERLAA